MQGYLLASTCIDMHYAHGHAHTHMHVHTHARTHTESGKESSWTVRGGNSLVLTCQLGEELTVLLRYSGQTLGAHWTCSVKAGLKKWLGGHS